MRQFLVFIHRWAGLAMAGFLIVVGLTGSLLAFYCELERLISPQLFAMPKPGVAVLDLATLAERAESLVPQARVSGLTVSAPDQVSVHTAPRIDPTTGLSFEIGFDQLFLDPWTGEELGRRMRGDLSQGLINLMPFIYSLHWELALGLTGFWILGIIAVLWTIDCFVGFYLTLPASFDDFWPRWKPAWLIKWKASVYRLNLDLHRAFGLWLWPMLFVFAWSSVMMDMRPVYDQVTHAIFEYESPVDMFRSLTGHQNETPRLDWRQAQAAGERLMAEQAVAHGFAVQEPSGLSYIPQLGVYGYEVRGSHDVFERAPKGGSTAVLFDGDSGALVKLIVPTGERTGNTVTSWLYALHMARVFGVSYQIFVCVLGLAITMLSVTGSYIWWKKRRARIFSRQRDRSAVAIDRGSPNAVADSN